MPGHPAGGNDRRWSFDAVPRGQRKAAGLVLSQERDFRVGSWTAPIEWSGLIVSA